MTLKHEDDTTGEQYDKTDFRSEVRDGLDRAGVVISGGFYDDLEYHPEDADLDELRSRLHEMVDSAVDSLVQAGMENEEENHD